MQKTLVLGALACAAVALCAWFLVVSGPAPLEAATAIGPGPVERESPAAGDAALVAPADEEPAARPVEAAAVADERVERTAVAAAPGPEEGLRLRLRVVDGDGEPVAGAEVLVLAEADEEQVKAYHDSARVDALLAEAGTPRAADANGELRLPAPRERPTLVVARHGNLWGSRRLNAEEEEDEGAPDDAEAPEEDEDTAVELRLRADVTLRARVVFGSGAPAPGAIVALRAQHRWGKWSLGTRPAEGEGAIAEFRHAQRLWANLLDEDSGLDLDPDHPFSLEVDAVVADRDSQPVDPAEPPAEPVTLVLPSCGVVEVRAIDETGAPFGGEATARLGIVREGEPRRLSPFTDVRRDRVSVDLEDGVARFPHVEPGHELEVSVSRQHARVSTRTFGRGPSRAGETRVFDVRLGDDHPVVRLRAVDPDGAPVAGERLGVSVVVRGGQSFNQPFPIPVETGDDGVFHLDLEPGWNEGMERELLVVQGASDDPEASARVDASRELGDGLHDLGDVVLEPPPLFVAGRVVTPAGEPVPRAELRLQARTESGRMWRQQWSFDQEADADGRFEIRGVRSGEEFRLGAASDGLAGAPREFVPGEEGLVLELQPEASLEGLVLLDATLPREEISLRLRGDVVDHLEWSERTATPGEDGTFRFGGLLPGPHSVEVVFQSHQRPFLKVDDVVVIAGETTRDARLDPVDLRGRVHAHHVVLRVPEEDTGLQGDVRFGPAGAEKLEERRWFHETSFWVFTEHDPVDLAISARGYRPERVENAGPEVELALTAGCTVLVELDPGVALPDPPVFIKAVLRPVDGGHNSIDWGAPAFDEGRAISVRVPGPGEMEVVWIREQRSSSGSSARTVEVEPAQTVQLQDAPEQRVQVTLTAEQLAKVLGQG